MIPILYPASATTFGNNGLGGLPDAMACTVTEERNGEYYLEMTYPQTGLHYADIDVDRIILATPADGADAQPFRIVHISRPIDGIVSIEAQHVSYALAATVALPVDVTSKSAQLAFNAIKEQSKPATTFTFYSSVQKQLAARFTLQQPVSLRAAIGGMEGSVLDLYGGELEWDRWRVNLWESRGSDSGVTIEYGKNMTAITADTDARSIVTGAIAFAKNADEVRCGEPAYAATANLYAHKHMTLIDLSSADPFPTVAELTAAAQQYVAASSVGQLATTIEVSFVPLWQTANANKLAQLQRLHLCDTVTVIHPGLRIQEKAKVVKTVYDVLRDRYESITVGTIQRNIADTISSMMTGSASSVSKLNTGGAPSKETLLDMIYPIGSIYASVNATSPETLFGGTWEQIKGRFLLGASTDYPAGSVGGEATHTLTVAEMPSHTHTDGTDPTNGISATTGGGTSAVVYWDSASGRATSAAGGGAAHNNMPPYFAVYIWKRTA